MRTIKFRAWDKREKRMIYADEIKDQKGDLWAVGFHGLSIAVDRDSFKDGNVTGWNIDHCLELMQFTGLPDKHGKEIYEGDIVQWQYPGQPLYISIVKWVDDEAMFLPNNMKDSVEIIGNMYEHSELLKEVNLP